MEQDEAWVVALDSLDIQDVEARKAVVSAADVRDVEARSTIIVQEEEEDQAQDHLLLGVCQLQMLIQLNII